MEVTVKDIQVTDKFGVNWMKRNAEGYGGISIQVGKRTFSLAWHF